MRHLLIRAVTRVRLSVQVQAMLFGAGLGWVAWELSRVGDASAFKLVMALIVLAAGSTSFVLYALHRQGAGTKATRGEHFARARKNLSLLGCGIALTIQGLQLTLA